MLPQGHAYAALAASLISPDTSTGFDAKVMRKIVSLRKTNLEKRREERELLDLYMSAIGMEE